MAQMSLMKHQGPGNTATNRTNNTNGPAVKNQCLSVPLVCVYPCSISCTKL